MRAPCLPAAAGWSRWLLILAVLPAASCRKVDRTAPLAPPPEIINTKHGIEMVLIPAGRFTMGSDRGRPEQAPAHEVSVDAFLMDRYEITQQAYAHLVPVNGSHFKGPQRPVEMIAWGEAALYCNMRSRDEGLQPCYDEQADEINLDAVDFEADGYRLPTEAEWEYACRAGSDSRHSFGNDPARLDKHAWFAKNAGKTTHPVGQKKPNAWGLYDMHGNVAEWCNDVYDKHYYRSRVQKDHRGPLEGEKYVLRGGAWNCSATACASAYRVGEDPGFQDACFARDAIGFRCVRKPPQKSSSRSVDSDGPPGDVRAPPESPSPQAGAAAGRNNDPASKTALVYAEIYLRHKTGAGHVERPERLTAIITRLEKAGLLSQMLRVEPRQAARQWITSVHAPQYVDRVEASCRQGAGFVDSPDAPASQQSYRVALEAAGGVLAAIDAVMEGKAENAFCAVRPPGHHALKDKAMGFCLFNNVAIAARYIQRKHKLAKVLIVDWDVHHGNGTQEMFYHDPTVFYFGVHQSPFYPGSGSAEEKGTGRGLNYTLNVPLAAGAGDREYRKAFEEVLQPAALAFRPDFVLISAGFDAHQDDPLGGMKVTAQGFAELTRIVKAIARRCCRARLVSVLEGGYGLEGLAASTEAHVRVLMGRERS